MCVQTTEAITTMSSLAEFFEGQGACACKSHTKVMYQISLPTHLFWLFWLCHNQYWWLDPLATHLYDSSSSDLLPRSCCCLQLRLSTLLCPFGGLASVSRCWSSGKTSFGFWKRMFSAGSVYWSENTLKESSTHFLKSSVISAGRPPSLPGPISSESKSSSDPGSVSLLSSELEWAAGAGNFARPVDVCVRVDLLWLESVIYTNWMVNGQMTGHCYIPCLSWACCNPSFSYSWRDSIRIVAKNIWQASHP